MWNYANISYPRTSHLEDTEQSHSLLYRARSAAQCSVPPPACAWAKTELREQEPVSDITFKLQMCHVCHVQRHALSVTGNTPYFRHSVKRLLVADGKSLILTCV